MSTFYIIYNPYANNSRGEEIAKNIKITDNDEKITFVDVTKIASFKSFFDGLEVDDKIMLCGGDGTINRFVNDLGQVNIRNDIYYYPGGSGNDFYRDVKKDDNSKFIKINEYIEKLPTVVVKGKKYKFINGVGYGIDGYCCQVGDEIRKTSSKKINYSGIAIKGLLFHYKPVKAHIIIDGERYCYEKVWLAPTMNGRYYGGGMMPAPNQNRGNSEISLMLIHGCSKIKTLMIFPSIFKGKHVKYKNNVKILSGKDIAVYFDEARAIQIDGETIVDVIEYHARID